MLQPVAGIFPRQGDNSHPDGQEEYLEEQAESINDDQAAVEFGAGSRLHQQGDDHDGHQANHGKASQPFLAALRQEQINREHQESQRRERELRRQQVEIRGQFGGHLRFLVSEFRLSPE